MKIIRQISGALTGGAMGALLTSANIWLMGVSGLSSKIGVTMTPAFAVSLVYKRVIWGAIWTLLLLIPLWKNRPVFRGVMFSLVPSAVILLVVLPSMGKGMLGFGAGSMMPAVVIGLGFIYGVFASFWYSAAR